MMYCGIDLHSNNCVVAVTDDADRVVAQKRLPNELAKITAFLARWKHELAGVVVESTGVAVAGGVLLLLAIASFQLRP